MLNRASARVKKLVTYKISKCRENEERYYSSYAMEILIFQVIQLLIYLT
jgi:hypothetical protein